MTPKGITITKQLKVEESTAVYGVQISGHQVQVLHNERRIVHIQEDPEQLCNLIEALIK